MMSAISLYAKPSTSARYTAIRNSSGMDWSASFTSLSGRWSRATASAERRPVDMCDSARASCQSSISSAPVRCGSRCFFRYELMKVLVRMRYSHALRLVPSRNWWKEANALAKVSCSRSSASAGLRVMRSAAEYIWSR